MRWRNTRHRGGADSRSLRFLSDGAGIIYYVPTSVRAKPSALTVSLFAAFFKGFVGLLVITLALAGCADLRLETPPPTEPEPDAVELVRRATVDDALAVADCASLAKQATGVSAGEVAELNRIAADAQAYVAALGGIYDSGLEPIGLPEYGGDNDASAEAIMDGGARESCSVADVIGELVAAASANQVNADAAESGDKARLLGSIATAQQVAALRLGRVAGGLDVTTDGVVGQDVMDQDVADHEVADHEVADQEDQDAAPAGLTVADYQAIVAGEDAARYALEVTAARLRGADLAGERAIIRAIAREHGARALYWAELGQIADTAQDPRQVAYVVPAGEPAELVLQFTSDLAELYATLLSRAAPGTRLALINALVQATLMREEWGGWVATFPGAPDITALFPGAAPAADAPAFPITADEAEGELDPDSETN